MKYHFYTEDIEGVTTLGVIPGDAKYSTLFRLGDSGWNTEKVQEIIDGVTISKKVNVMNGPMKMCIFLR